MLKAIDYVLTQTAKVDEIVVIDDGSTDGTPEAIQQRHGSRVKLIWQNNQGVSAARNQGIRHAQGDWIAFLDSDDVWLPTKIERQLECLELFGSSMGVCFTDNFFKGDPKLKLSKFEESMFSTTAEFGLLDEPAKLILQGKEPFFTSSFLIKRSLLEAVNGFDQALIIGEDTDLFFRLSFLTKFCFVSEALVGIDRDPSRTVGLCNLYFSRNDIKYETLQRRFYKWLAMPEVAGTEHELPARQTLRLLCYDSAECKIHQFRLRAAFQEICKLKALGENYGSVFLNLCSRKARKWRAFLTSIYRPAEVPVQ